MGNTNKLMKGLGSGDVSWQDDFRLTDNNQIDDLFKIELDNGNVTMNGTLTVQGVPITGGGGGGSSGVLHLNVVPVQNTTTSAGEVLMTYTMPAATLTAGHGIRVTAWGDAAGNATSCTTMFGSTELVGRSESIPFEEFKAVSEVFYSGASAQNISAVSFVASSAGNGHLTGAEAVSGPIVIKVVCTAQSVGIVNCYGLLVELI